MLSKFPLLMVVSLCAWAQSPEMPSAKDFSDQYSQSSFKSRAADYLQEHAQSIKKQAPFFQELLKHYENAFGGWFGLKFGVNTKSFSDDLRSNLSKINTNPLAWDESVGLVTSAAKCLSDWEDQFHAQKAQHSEAAFIKYLLESFKENPKQKLAGITIRASYLLIENKRIIHLQSDIDQFENHMSQAEFKKARELFNETISKSHHVALFPNPLPLAISKEQFTNQARARNMGEYRLDAVNYQLPEELVLAHKSDKSAPLRQKLIGYSSGRLELEQRIGPDVQSYLFFDIWSTGASQRLSYVSECVNLDSARAFGAESHLANTLNRCISLSRLLNKEDQNKTRNTFVEFYLAKNTQAVEAILCKIPEVVGVPLVSQDIASLEASVKYTSLKTNIKPVEEKREMIAKQLKEMDSFEDCEKIDSKLIQQYCHSATASRVEKGIRDRAGIQKDLQQIDQVLRPKHDLLASLDGLADEIPRSSVLCAKLFLKHLETNIPQFESEYLAREAAISSLVQSLAPHLDKELWTLAKTEMDQIIQAVPAQEGALFTVWFAKFKAASDGAPRPKK